MNLEKAIKTAIEYEERVRDLYLNNADKFKDPVGRKIFNALGVEEQNHVEYLNSRLHEWEKSGSITLEKLDTIVPDKDVILANIKKLEKRSAIDDFEVELEIFKKALVLEVETSGFYKNLVDELPESDAGLFKRFIEIEEGHEAIVQAEIDTLVGVGFWFDFMEFDLEAG